MDPTSAGTAFGSFAMAAAASIWAVISARKASNAQSRLADNLKETQNLSSADLARSNLEVSNAYKARADEWKAEYDRQHQEIQIYRSFVHEKAKKDQAEYLAVVNENASLKARTDLSPVLEHMEQQARYNLDSLELLRKLSVAMEALVIKLAN